MGRRIPSARLAPSNQDSKKMSRKSLSSGQIRSLLDVEEVTDEQALLSDIGGDSDAEDDDPATVNTSVSSTRSLAPISDAEDDDIILNDETLDCNMEDEENSLHNLVCSSDSEDSADENEDCDNVLWTKIPTMPKTFKRTKFDRPFGPTKPVDVASSPLVYFSQILTDRFLDYVVEQSNLFANQKNKQLDMSLLELKALLGMLLIMGYHKLPSMMHYWSVDQTLHVKAISQIMTQNRFKKLIRSLHLNDNETMPTRDSPEFDKLYKVRPFLLHLSKKFKQAFNPGQHLSVDESMIAFKGRSSLKQYMPMKPTKRGYKVWAIACATTGYLLAFDVYTGKSCREPGVGLGENVVLQLCKEYENVGYCVYFDNFFTSIALLKELLARKVFACGTIRQNRKNYPKDELIADKKLGRGESDFAQCEEISVIKWMDRGKKAVSIASNMHNPQKMTTVARTNNHGTKESIPCPDVVASYNRCMGGVDRLDQMLQTYKIGWRSRRWWMRIFYYLVDLAVVNAYVLYITNVKNIDPKKRCMTALKFRMELAQELINGFSSRKGPEAQGGENAKHARNSNRTRFAQVGIHYPVKGETYRRCAQCSAAKKEKRTKVVCNACQVALCVNCFKQFHSK